jgi:hypothetical protein
MLRPAEHVNAGTVMLWDLILSRARLLTCILSAWEQSHLPRLHCVTSACLYLDTAVPKISPHAFGTMPIREIASVRPLPRRKTPAPRLRVQARCPQPTEREHGVDSEQHSGRECNHTGVLDNFIDEGYSP